MNAFISKRTTRMPFKAPISAPMPSAISSETGKASHAGSSVSPPPAPPVPKVSATIIAARAMTDSIERSICPATSVNDSPTAMMPTNVDCSRILRKMPIWKNLGMNSPKPASAMRRIIQTRLSSTNASIGRWRRAPVRCSKDFN